MGVLTRSTEETIYRRYEHDEIEAILLQHFKNELTVRGLVQPARIDANLSGSDSLCHATAHAIFRKEEVL